LLRYGLFYSPRLGEVETGKNKNLPAVNQYLERQSWMFEQANENKDALPGGLKIKEKHVE